MRSLLVLLVSVFFLASAVAIHPAVPLFASPAYADDDDDGGGGRGRGGGWRGGNGGRDWDDWVPPRRSWRPFKRMFRAPQRRARPRARRPAAPPPIVVPDEIVVAAVSGAALDQLAAEGFTIVARAPLTLLPGEVARLTAPAGVDLDAARLRILTIAPAAVVDANHLYRPVEMHCQHGDCPAFEMIGWSVPPSVCNLDVTIGMIDTVVNVEHEALRDQAIEIVSVVGKDDRASSAVHGTAVAALLVGDEESRTPGLMPGARLLAVEAFHRDGAGDAADVFKIVRGLDQLDAREVRVVNMSFAGPQNAVLASAVEAASGAGALLVAAAGNNGPKAEPAYPGAYPSVIAVTAVDRSQRVYRQAGRGGHVAFSAPGVRLWTAASISGGRFRSGTSYAAPFVSAAVAAALAGGAEQATADLLDELAGQAIDLGDPGRDPVFGWGLVQAPQC